MSAGVAPSGGGHVDLDAHALEHGRDLDQIVAMAEAERGRAQDVAAGARGLLRARRRRVRAGQGADELVKGLGGAPVLFLLVGGQLERDHGDGKRQGLGQAARVVLDELRRAAGAHDHGLRGKALEGVPRGLLE